MPLKVCQLCAVDFTLKHFLTALIDGMAGEGWNVTSVCSDGKFVPALRGDGYRIETLTIARGLNPWLHAVSLARLIALMRREKFDVLHAHTPVAALLGRFAARVAGVPFVVYTAHGFYFHDRMRPLPRAIFTFLEWLGGRCTDLMFTQSAEDAQTAIDAGLMPAARVLAIGNGVDTRRFDASLDVALEGARARVRAEFAIPADAVVVGMIGRLVAEKGYAEFFAAAASAAPQYQQLYFIAVGERLESDHAGAIDADLRRAQAALGTRLTVTGLRADIPELLAAMDIFTLPSYREGMPRTIIEAMMMSLPVVATNIRGSREEVIDGHTGLLVPVRDAAALAAALLRLARAPGERARMGAAGRARALALYDERAVVATQLAAIRAHLPAALKARV